MPPPLPDIPPDDGVLPEVLVVDRPRRVRIEGINEATSPPLRPSARQWGPVNYMDNLRYASLMASLQSKSVKGDLRLELVSDGEMTEEHKKEVTYQYGVARALTALQMVSSLHEVVSVLVRGRKSFI